MEYFLTITFCSTDQYPRRITHCVKHHDVSANAQDHGFDFQNTSSSYPVNNEKPVFT